ncbi:hypothetical protein TIFTF001_025415 [Ficus carica]|uniref:DUF8039 domain-containing protein n=1 Tax=Ficus carica TaxID=3494 RepID=A0AA88DKJ9_FICCA|nr:hypothetical protein TIFTF001_025415 [Ficus carica]
MEHSKKGRAQRKNPLDPTIDGKRRATIMKRVHMARKRGERIQVTFDEKGQLEGKHGDELMSWIGVLAREHDRGSEIRTNNEYSSRGGRDGYRKLDQEKTGTDGELKDPAFKKVSELIMEYNTQESQCTFESVGTSDGRQLLVAFGRAWLKSLPTDTVHGIPLGEGNVRVSINVPKLKKSPLPIPRYEATTVEDAVNGFVAWLKTLVELDKSMNKVQQGAQQQQPLFDFNNMNMAMRPLAYYAHSSMRQGRVTILIRLCRYLEELCRINGQAEKFVFVSPTFISPVRTDTEDVGMRERAGSLISLLRDAPKGRLYLVPHNRGRHWVLGDIDPWEDLVLYFDPLREKKRDDFAKLMNM